MPRFRPIILLTDIQKHKTTQIFFKFSRRETSVLNFPYWNEKLTETKDFRQDILPVDKNKNSVESKIYHIKNLIIIYFLYICNTFGISSHIVCLGVNIERVTVESPFLIFTTRQQWLCKKNWKVSFCLLLPKQTNIIQFMSFVIQQSGSI